MPTLQEFDAQQRAGEEARRPGAGETRTPSPRPAGRTTLQEFDAQQRGEAVPEPAASSAPPHPLPSGLGEEIAEFPRLYKQAAREHFVNMSKAAVDTWEHGSLFGKVWSGLETAAEGSSYVMSPLQAGAEMAAQPLETYIGGGIQALTGAKQNPLRGLAHYLGEEVSLGAQFFVDPLLAAVKIAGPLTRAGRLYTKAKESGYSPERVFSAATRTERVPRQMTAPDGSLVFDSAGKPVWHRGTKVDPATGMGEILYDRKPWAADQLRRQRRWWGIKALESDRRRAEMEEFQKLMGMLGHDDRMDFNYYMDGDAAVTTLPTGLQPIAAKLRRMLDEGEQRLVSIGALKTASGDYWPRLFKDPYQGQALSDLDAFHRAQAAANPRRPVRGSKGAAGLKARTVPTLRESIDKGMELVTDDPIAMALTRLDGMDRYYYGTMLLREMKAQPYVRFFPWNKVRDAEKLGLHKLNDSGFEARLMPASVDKTFKATAVHEEGFDKVLRKSLNEVARFLGLKPKSPGRWEDPYLTAKPSVQGYAHPRGDLVRTFGNNDITSMHEIGHHIQFQYDLASVFEQGHPKAWKQLDDLGLARFSTPRHLLSASDVAYLTDRDEKIANLFHAYWHAPELLEHLAPDAAQVLRDWLNEPSRAGLKAVVNNVKPSVVMGADKKTQVFEELFQKTFPGIRHLGEWYAPETVATVFNNFVSTGLKHQQLSDAMRKVGNLLNMAQLSLSAFHLSMVSTDSAVSAVRQVIPALLRGDVKRAGVLGAAAVPIAGQIYSGWRQTKRGNFLRKGLLGMLNPQDVTPELLRIMHGFEVSGGRIGMDMIHSSSGLGGFLQAMKGGYLEKAVEDTFKSVNVKTPIVRQALGAAKVGMRAIETTVEPVMTEFVPRVKLGVFHDMAADWIARNPHAMGEEFIAGMQGIWDHIDNRLGEMVYDNLSWNKILKDLSFLAVRAVGWNMGTIRELGGGLADAVKQGHLFLTEGKAPEMTERMAYSMALPFVVGLQGATINWLLTGQPPQSMLDYFFPRTGKLTKDGQPDRLSIPSYVKDVYMYNYDPVQTAVNKLHPLLEIMSEVYENKDYGGGIIRAPYELAHEWAPTQYAKYAARQLVPFGIRGVRQQLNEGADFWTVLASEFGFVPANKSITNPKKAENYQRVQDIKAYRRALQERMRGQ